MTNIHDIFIASILGHQSDSYGDGVEYNIEDDVDGAPITGTNTLYRLPLLSALVAEESYDNNSDIDGVELDGEDIDGAPIDFAEHLAALSYQSNPYINNLNDSNVATTTANVEIQKESHVNNDNDLDGEPL